MKLNRKLFLVVALVLSLAMATTGTLAYLTDGDSAKNVMTLGKVDIEQNEQQRDENGELEPFEQDKPAYPAVGPVKWADEKLEVGDDEYDVFTDELKNVIDKIVTVTNTGKSDAYVRTIIALEAPEYDPKDLIHANVNGDVDYTPWTPVTIDGVNYVYSVFTYADALEPQETSAPSLLQLFLDKATTNEDVAAYGDTWEVLVLSQAIQVAGFEDVDAADALNEGFGEATAANVAEWFKGIAADEGGEGEDDTNKIAVNPSNFEDTDFTVPGQTFELNGEFGDVTIPVLGEGSVISFDDANVDTLTIADDAVLEGSAKIQSISVRRNSTEPITVTLRDANLDIEGDVKVENTDGKSILNIENSRIEAATIYVGEHVNNNRAALAELNITNSYVSCEENGLGSTINVWGRSGVKAKIHDSEIYTYSRGWHQSEDANDNSITFQGATSIDVDIQRSNMHLYGARSIINARQYGSEATTIKTNIEDSLIWVVTKSSHGENTLPVWGFNEDNINDSILLFTKNTHQNTPAVFKSFVYGNPTIYGDYHVTTQCQWDAPIALADGQTVTFASDANVSIYEDAGNVQFVKNGSANVVLENGAVVENIGGIN